jgi:hypothetical protein
MVGFFRVTDRTPGDEAPPNVRPFTTGLPYEPRVYAPWGIYYFHNIRQFQGIPQFMETFRGQVVFGLNGNPPVRHTAYRIYEGRKFRHPAMFFGCQGGAQFPPYIVGEGH